jgi:oligopeptide transport system substrate-binding protein
MFVSGGANNQTGWSNTRYDALIAAAAREPDQARRMEMFKEAETILLDEMPVLPLYYYVSSNMVKPYVRGFYSNAQDYHPLDAISIDLESKREFEASEETQ